MPDRGPSDPLAQLARNWEAHAQSDPLWAILSQDDKTRRQWGAEEFFATGRTDVQAVFSQMADHGVNPRGGRALDFGCGVGRLTQALAARFDTVVGVDISPTMIALASELNPDPERIRFRVNQADDLALLGSDEFDFVYTVITLQHIPPDLILRYLSEFLRILKPGGILVFQLPSHLRPEREAGYRLEPMPDEACRAALAVVDPPRAIPASTEIPIRVAVRNTSPLDWNSSDDARLAPDTHWMAGDGAWKCSKVGQLDIGNHWLKEDGATVIRDDGRASLPDGIRAGGEAEIEFVVKSPSRPGTYFCEVDLVQERVCWFAGKGSPTARFRIEVGGLSALDRIVRRLARLLRLRDKRGAPASRGLGSDPARTGVTSVQWSRLLEKLPEPSGRPEPYAMHGIPRPEVERFLRERGADLAGADESWEAGWEWVSYWYCARKL